MKAEKIFMAGFGILFMVIAVMVVGFAGYEIWGDMRDRATCEKHDGIYTRNGCSIPFLPKLP